MLIGNRDVKNFGKPYIIAELASNHNGDMSIARKMIDEAKECGCDCVKFQSWSKDTVFSKKVYEENYFLGDDYRNRKDFTLEQIVEKFSVSEKELSELIKYCDGVGIDFACTPFSKKETDFLVTELNVKFIKVASSDLNNYPFLDYIARKMKLIVLSTGLSTLSEIDCAVKTIEDAGNKRIILLHCVANYPPKDNNVNLNNIDMLRDNYPDYPVGFSDHSLGVEIPLAAVAKGACMLEKHFTLDKNMFGWDHKVSADKNEMRSIVIGSEKIFKALGSYRRVINEDDIVKIPAFRRSIVSTVDIPKGKRIERCDLDCKRPGCGIEPKFIDLIVGRIANRDIARDEIISLNDF